MTVEEGMIVRFNQNEHDIITTAVEAVLISKAQVERQESNMSLILNTIAKLRGIDTQNNNYTLDKHPETKLYRLVQVIEESAEPAKVDGWGEPTNNEDVSEGTT